MTAGMIALGPWCMTFPTTTPAATGSRNAISAWPLLGRTLLAYGLAARIPVILVMLVAMLQNWGTHYDVPPPNFPAGVPVMAKWFQIGVMPQLFLWIPYTILSGALLGGIALLAAGKKDR